MRVLQLGSIEWSKKYELTKNLEWHFNDFPPIEKVDEKDPKKKKIEIKNYDVILITGPTNLTKKNWADLKGLVPPYQVLYLPKVLEIADNEESYFLKSIAAQEITEDPQYLINKLEERYFVGQTGMRVAAVNFKLNDRQVHSFEYLGHGELKLNLDTNNEWINLGVYKTGIYIDPGKRINFWLTMKNKNFQVRMRIFIQNPGSDGDVKDQVVIDLTKFQKDEYFSQLEVLEYYRNATISLEVKGSGELTIGTLHARWGRDGAGDFISGGKRIVDPATREDIAYYFNPGDLKPPLNVYFSGAREREGFEGYFLMKRLNAPMLLFTDMRLAVGGFYDDAEGYFGKKIIEVIKQTLKKLGFDPSQLVMTGISMGTYPAIKYGAKLKPYAINVAKPLLNLGYIARRAALDRPGGFDTIFDVDGAINRSLSFEKLKELDQKTMNELGQSDLSKTRLFVAYMKNDDYDDHALAELEKSPAVRNAIQFSIKGFDGRHNDDPAVNYWFIYRLYEIMGNFGRKYE